ncbi:MAG: radical SAM protein [Polyangiaceae bacterium]
MRAVAALALGIVKNRLGAVPHPGWCTYLVTYRCNARCKMCDSWRMKPGTELAPNDVAGVFSRLGRLDVVRLSGGEPFLREDLLEIAEVITQISRPRVLHVTTNGSMPDRVVEFAEKYSRPRRLAFMVSLDGHRHEHDANRGEQVTYDSVIETVRRLVALRRRRKIDVSVNHTVISPESLDDAERVREELGRLGVDVQSVLAYSESSMYGIKLRGKRAEHVITRTGYPLHPRLAGADVVGFVQRELERARRLSSPLRRLGKSYYLRGLLARLRGDPSPNPRPRCVALRSHVRLLPDGRMPVCQFNTEIVGDLTKQSLREIAQQAGTRAARAWVDACPGCWAECEVIPSAIYTGDFLRDALGAPFRSFADRFAAFPRHLFDLRGARQDDSKRASLA